MTAGAALPGSAKDSHRFTALLPIMAVVLVAFVVIGLAMPVLPLHVHQGLGLSTFVVGLVAGSQFAASLISRPWAGMYSDARGGKRAMTRGLLAASASGLLYMLSLQFLARPEVSVSILLAGRALLGGAESFIITGALSWGLSLVDSQHAGKVMAWIGAAMFAAIAAGAPAGTGLYASHGFGAVALATVLTPLLTLLVSVPLKSPAVALGITRASSVQVLGAIWIPGIGLALSCTGFGAIVAFAPLLFASRGWGPSWPVFTAYAVAFIAARVFFGHLPDRLGGARVALVCLVIEAIGQFLIWLAPSYSLTLVGAALTGFGFSLVFPAFGVEAVKRVPVQSRGLAMGAYTAFLDLALGIASPALGWVGSVSSLASVFLASAFAVAAALLVAARLLARPADHLGNDGTTPR